MGEIGKGNLKLQCGSYAHCKGVNKVILNWQRPLWEGDHEVVKSSGRDEAMWVKKHMCMKAMLGISLYSSLYFKLAKTMSYRLCFLFSKNWRTRWTNRLCTETGEREEGKRLEVAQTMYTHVSKCKKRQNRGEKKKYIYINKN
jgi:hypothetical protein